MIFLIAMITFKVVKPKHWYQRSIILLLYFLLILVPMSSPGDVNAPNSYPSGNGLRFLPGVLMLFFCIYYRKIAFIFGHLFWILSFVWSPEAGIHSTCVWGPLYLFTYLKNKQNNSLFNLVKGCINLLSIFIFGLIVFILVFYLVFEEIPEIKVYLTYYFKSSWDIPFKYYWYFSCNYLYCTDVVLFSI